MTALPLAVAIVGSGAVGRAHARVAVAHPDLRLVALVDPDLNRRQALADFVERILKGARPATFGALPEALDAFRIDVVAACARDVSRESIDDAIGSGTQAVIGSLLDQVVDDLPGDRLENQRFAAHLRQYEDFLEAILEQKGVSS